VERKDVHLIRWPKFGRLLIVLKKPGVLILVLVLDMSPSVLLVRNNVMVITLKAVAVMVNGE
jgi:hypothetical protein